MFKIVNVFSGIWFIYKDWTIPSTIDKLNLRKPQIQRNIYDDHEHMEFIRTISKTNGCYYQHSSLIK